MFKRYPCVKCSSDINDGTACLATVCESYNMDVPFQSIMRTLGVGIRETNALRIVNAAKNIGFTVECVRVNGEDVLKSRITLPAIMLAEDNIQRRFVVVHDIRKHRVIIADPIEGVVKYSHKEFLRIWSGVIIFLAPKAE